MAGIYKPTLNVCVRDFLSEWMGGSDETDGWVGWWLVG